MSETLTIHNADDVSEVIEKGPRRRGRLRLIWALALGGVCFEAYSNAALSAGLGPLIEDFDLTASEVVLLTASAQVMSVIFSPVAGRLGDLLGRVPVMLIAKVVALAGAVAAAFAPSLAVIILGRVLAGVAFGLDLGVAMTYLSEFTPRKQRSRLNLWQGMWYASTTFNLAIALLVYNVGVHEEIWRWSLGSAGVLAIVIGVSQATFLYESPLWLASKNQIARAAKSVRKVYGVEIQGVNYDSHHDSAQTTSRAPLNDYIEIFRRPYLRRTLLAATCNAMQGMQYTAVGWYLPVISLALFGEDFESATTAALFFNAFGIIGGFSSVWFARRMGMRQAPRAGFAIVAVVLVVMGTTFGSLPLVVATLLPAVFIFAHSAGPGPSGVSLAPLAYPSELRGLGSSFAIFMGNLGAVAGLVAFPLVRAALGTGTAITVLAVIPVVGFIACAVVRWDPDKALTAPAEYRLPATQQEESIQ